MRGAIVPKIRGSYPAGVRGMLGDNDRAVLGGLGNTK
jgi:hypothetical protein